MAGMCCSFDILVESEKTVPLHTGSLSILRYTLSDHLSYG